MPSRKVPLITEGVYHVLNRGNASAPIFNRERDYQRFMLTLCYYQYTEPPLRFSHFSQLLPAIKSRLSKDLQSKAIRIEIIAFCLMPNHFHFLLKQKEEQGICDFIRQSTSSYSHYFNTKYKRRGSLFEGRFKAIRVETETELLHLSRYIHLNPYSSNLVKSRNRLCLYRYSSLPEYVGKTETEICQKSSILSNFKDKDSYLRFVLDRADYQKSLEAIKHATFDDGNIL